MGSDRQVQWLVDNYGELLYRVALAIVGDRALAEDVVQETLVKAWLAMPSWEGDVPVRWARRVARNTAISVMRRRSRLAGNVNLAERASTDPAVEHVVERRSEVEAVRRAITELEEVDRVLLVLRETDELGYEEMAEIMHMSPAAVRTRLYRARYALKAKVSSWGR